MNETNDALHGAHQTRIRALVIPREHGAWGLLLVPLFTGVVAGYSSEHRIWPLLIFTVAALSLFWLRTPVESLLGTGSLTANSRSERWVALVATALLAAIATACLTSLMWKGQNLRLLLLGGAASLAFLAQSVLRSLGRKTRMAAQLVGAIGLVCTAPSSQKFASGKIFLLAYPILFAFLIIAAFWHFLPPLVVIAFIPALVRGTVWFYRKSEPLDVRSLGWSEMKQGFVFGLLLAVAFIYS